MRYQKRVKSPPLANVFTLGARDLAALKRFYISLGWPIVIEQSDYVAFQLGGVVIAFFPSEKLADDGRERVEEGDRIGIRFTIAILVNTPLAVDAMAHRFRAAGGRITKPAVDAEFFVGRSAYVSDPEGNYWEIVWTPKSNPITAAAEEAAGRRDGGDFDRTHVILRAG